MTTSNARKKTSAPNPVAHAIVSWLSHSATWSLIIGVVLAVVAVAAPSWAGREDLQEACNQLALLLAGLFGALAAGQKVADGLSNGRTSAFNRHVDLVDRSNSSRDDDNADPGPGDGSGGDDDDDDDGPAGDAVPVGAGA